MRKILIIGLIVIAAFLFGIADYWGTPPSIKDDTKMAAHIETPTPSFTFKDINQRTYAITNFKGKKVILNFWATWCTSCIEEFPILLKAAVEENDIVLLALSVDKKGTDFEKFFSRLDKASIRFLDHQDVVIGLDPTKEISQDLFQVYKFPETFLLDENQNIKRKISGKINHTTEIIL